MRGLEIGDAKGAEILLGRQNRGVPENPPKVFEISSTPEVLASEGMTASMRRHPNSLNLLRLRVKDSAF